MVGGCEPPPAEFRSQQVIGITIAREAWMRMIRSVVFGLMFGLVLGALLGLIGCSNVRASKCGAWNRDAAIAICQCATNVGGCDEATGDYLCYQVGCLRTLDAGHDD